MASSVKKKGKGLTVSFKLEGGDELLKKLQSMGKKAGGKAVHDALQHGIEQVEQRIRSDAPGPHIVTEWGVPEKGTATPNSPTIQIGPDKEHWYYQFFEFGVQPFEIDMVKRKSKRTAINRKTGKRMTGRKVRGEAEVMRFSVGSQVVFAKHIRRGGMAARPFLRRNFLGSARHMEARFGEKLKKEVIDPHLESK